MTLKVTFSILILSQLISLFSTAQAQTKVSVIENPDGSTTLSAALDPQDSEKLYNIMNVREKEGRSGFLKRFVIQDEIFEVICSKSIMPVVDPYNCTIKITNGPGINPVKKVKNSLIASIIDKKNSFQLYYALKVEAKDSQYGKSKEFISSDENASFACGENIDLNDVTTYACTAIISLD